MANQQKARAKGRKIGNKIKKPAQKRYVNENRRDKNKLRRAKKIVKKFGKAVKIKLHGILETITN